MSYTEFDCPDEITNGVVYTLEDWLSLMDNIVSGYDLVKSELLNGEAEEALESLDMLIATARQGQRDMKDQCESKIQ